MGEVLHSVIIPTYNRKDMLAETIESVRQQTFHDIEIIVVDDCSTDGTGDFVRSIPDERIKYFANEHNSGSEVSRNLGFRNARGKYITFIDDDDYYTDYEFFAHAIDIHERSDEPLAIVCADGIMFETETGITKKLKPLKPGRTSGIEFILQQGYEYHKPTSTFPAVFRADILRQAGLADMMIFDSQTYMFAALYGDVHVMPDFAGIYILHRETRMETPSFAFGRSMGRKCANFTFLPSSLKIFLSQLVFCVNKNE